MVEIGSENLEREITLLLDISMADNSVQACQIADNFVAQLSGGPSGVLVDINAGDLLLTRGVLTKIRHQIQRAGALLGIMYATLPQTQQAALDEGLFVKEKLLSAPQPIRQALPFQSAGKNASRSRESAGLSVDLPDFNPSRQASQRDMDIVFQEPPRASEPATVDDFWPVSLPSSEIPKLSEVEVETSELLKKDAFSLLTEDTASIQEAIVQEVEYPETAFDTLYLRQTLRSGQTARFRGNIVVVGDVHAGSELTAGGDILVWGELRGIAHAGAEGNYKAEIRAMKIEALQLRIADYIARRPDRIYYHKDSEEFANAPEVARVADGEIRIFKTP